MKLRDWDSNLKLRLGGEFVLNIVFWTFFPFLSIVFARAFGKGTAGLLMVLSQSLAVAANLLGGYFTDRYGRKRMMVFAASGQAVGYGIFAAASSSWLPAPALAFAGFTIASVATSFYYPASQAMVADVVPEKHRSEVFAVFYTFVNVAVVIGPLLGSVLYVGHPAAMPAAASAVCVTMAVLLSARLRETNPAQASNSAGGVPASSWKEAMRAQLRNYRIIGSDRAFLLFIAAGILLSQTFMQLDLLLPVYLEETVHSASVWSSWDLKLTGERLFGLLVSENGLLVALFTVAIARWSSLLKDRWIFIGGALCYAASMALFGQAGGVWSLAGVMVVFTLAELMCAGPQQMFVTRLAPERMRGQYFAASSLRFTIGRTLAPLSIPLCGLIGFDWTFTLLALLAVAAAVLYKIMFDWHDGAAPSPDVHASGKTIVP